MHHVSIYWQALSTSGKDEAVRDLPMAKTSTQDTGWSTKNNKLLQPGNFSNSDDGQAARAPVPVPPRAQREGEGQEPWPHPVPPRLAPGPSSCCRAGDAAGPDRLETRLEGTTPWQGGWETHHALVPALICPFKAKKEATTTLQWNLTTFLQWNKRKMARELKTINRHNVNRGSICLALRFS